MSTPSAGPGSAGRTSTGRTGPSWMKHAVLIGAGRMGSAMARGWLADLGAAGLARLSVVEPSPDDDVVEAASENLIVLNPAPELADIVVLAVKPQGFTSAAYGLRAWLGPDTLVVSIMAGVTIARIGQALGVTKIARAMPNTPGSIGMGATAFALSDACGDAFSQDTHRADDHSFGTMHTSHFHVFPCTVDDTGFTVHDVPPHDASLDPDAVPVPVPDAAAI